MQSMFEDCSKLNYIDVSNFNTQKVTEMSYMFYDCSKLIFIDISNFTIIKNETLFINLPNKGQIKIKEEYKDSIHIIPKEWEKIY